MQDLGRSDSFTRGSVGSRTSNTFIKKNLEIKIPLDEPNVERNKSFITPDNKLEENTPLLNETESLGKELAELDDLSGDFGVKDTISKSDSGSEDTEFERVGGDNSSVGKTSDGT